MAEHRRDLETVVTQQDVKRFLVEVAGPAGPLDDEESAVLRRALLDHGALTAEPAPQGRFVDPATVLAVAAAGVQTAAALADVIGFLQGWRAKRRNEGRDVAVRVGGQPLPEEPVTAQSPLVAHLLRQPGAASRHRYALIVAVNSYEDNGLQALRSPSTDADALGAVLADPSIGGYEVTVLRDSDERTIRRRIGAFFADRDPDDLLLLHFSCHGIKDRQNRLHLAATDTELQALGATSIPASYIDSQMAQTSARRVVLILDCCFSGAYSRDMAARADRSVNVAEEFSHSGRVVLTASSATEYAFEGAGLAGEQAVQPSVFTSALVEGLREGTADLDGDGEVSVDDWYTYAFRTVTSRGTGQAPTKSSTAVSGNFVIARGVRGAALPTHLREDIASDRVPLRLAAVEQLALLLHTDGPMQATARAELERLHTDDDSIRVRDLAASALGVALAPSRAGAPGASASPASPDRATAGGGPALPAAAGSGLPAAAGSGAAGLGLPVAAGSGAAGLGLPAAADLEAAGADRVAAGVGVGPGASADADGAGAGRETAVPRQRSATAVAGGAAWVGALTRSVGGLAVVGAAVQLATVPSLRSGVGALRYFDLVGPALLALCGAWMAAQPRRAMPAIVVAAGMAAWTMQVPFAVVRGSYGVPFVTVFGMVAQLLALAGVLTLLAVGADRRQYGRGFAMAGAGLFAVAMAGTAFSFGVPSTSSMVAMPVAALAAYLAAGHGTWARGVTGVFALFGAGWYFAVSDTFGYYAYPPDMWVTLSFFGALAATVLIALLKPAPASGEADAVPGLPLTALGLTALAAAIMVVEFGARPGSLGIIGQPWQNRLGLALAVCAIAAIVRTPTAVALAAGMLSWAPGVYRFDIEPYGLSGGGHAQRILVVAGWLALLAALWQQQPRRSGTPIGWAVLAGTVVLVCAFAARAFNEVYLAPVEALLVTAVLVPVVVLSWRLGGRVLAAALAGIMLGTIPAVLWALIIQAEDLRLFGTLSLVLPVAAVALVSVLYRQSAAVSAAVKG